MTRKVCVVTGSRAEYGLLKWVMRDIADAPELELQVVVTGMHLSPRFGDTYREIEGDGFRITRKVDVGLELDAPPDLARAVGRGVAGFGEVFDELRPDVVLVLGDRFEIVPVAVAATLARIPLAHAHGGETSEGAIDEAFRHAITKMSHLHFVSAEAYRNRVIQLGEDPDRVFVVGAFGLDNLERETIPDRGEVERALNFDLGPRSLLITFHPVTLENDTARGQIGELLAALGALTDTRLVFTMPNADTGGRAVSEMIEQFVDSHPNARAYTSLGHRLYLAVMRQVDAVVGNSSSGLIEAPALRKATVNIGDRQKGRLRASSVIDCAPDRAAIGAAIERARSPDFADSLKRVENPYGKPGASARVTSVLKTYPFRGILKKKFYDIPIQH